MFSLHFHKLHSTVNYKAAAQIDSYSKTALTNWNTGGIHIETSYRSCNFSHCTICSQIQCTSLQMFYWRFDIVYEPVIKPTSAWSTLTSQPHQAIQYWYMHLSPTEHLTIVSVIWHNQQWYISQQQKLVRNETPLKNSHYLGDWKCHSKPQFWHMFCCYTGGHHVKI
jgi:hypothetical protein